MAKGASWYKRAEKIVNRVNRIFPNPEFKNWKSCEELILSAIVTCEQVNKFKIETKNAALILNQTASYLNSKGKYNKTAVMYKKSLDIWSKNLGSNYSLFSSGLNNLAELYKVQGKYSKALPLYLSSLTINKKKQLVIIFLWPLV